MDSIKTLFYISLFSASDEEYTFTAGLLLDEYIEEHGTSELTEHTVRAEFTTKGLLGTTLTIDGNGWRDIEAGDYLEDFIRDVLLGDTDPEEFLSNIAEALGTEDEPGELLDN
jgi:hypothetical protein